MRLKNYINNRFISLLTAVALYALFATPPAFASVEYGARVCAVKGDVEIIRAKGKKEKLAELLDCHKMILNVGDKVKTGTNGSAIILWYEGNSPSNNCNQLQLDKLSLIEVSADGPNDIDNTYLFQEKGLSTLNVPKGNIKKNAVFTVKTPTAVCGVRGTRFHVRNESYDVNAKFIIVSSVTTSHGSWNKYFIVPPELADRVDVGTKVVIPFGSTNKHVISKVVEVLKDAPSEDELASRHYKTILCLEEDYDPDAEYDVPPPEKIPLKITYNRSYFYSEEDSIFVGGGEETPSVTITPGKMTEITTGKLASAQSEKIPDDTFKGLKQRSKDLDVKYAQILDLYKPPPEPEFVPEPPKPESPLPGEIIDRTIRNIMDDEMEMFR